MSGSIFDTEMNLDQFQSDLFKNMNTYRKENLFCDVTLDVSGRFFPCHRLVLSMASPYFRAMFNGDFKESRSAVVVMKDIEVETMDHILNAVYTSQLRLSPANVYFILRSSHFLQINAIVDKCVACIIRNNRIWYLIDVCLFAETFDFENLYSFCLEAIGNNLIRWGKTDAIKKLPLNIFISILSNGDFDQIEDEILLLIMKWSKSTNAASNEVRLLLQLPTIKDRIIKPSIIAELICNIDDVCASQKNENNDDETQFNFNVYLNAVDEKTGAIGCGLLKLSDDVESGQLPSLYNFHNVNSFNTKICRAGKRIFCFESDNVAKKYTLFNFENFENDVKDEVHFPEDLIWNNAGCDIVPINHKIYLISKQSNSHIWRYDSHRDTWCKVFQQVNPSEPHEGKRPALHGFPGSLGATSLGNVLYVVVPLGVLSFNIRNSSTRKIIDYPEFFDFDYKYAAVCAFDGKIAISGSLYGGISRNIFCIYDVISNTWLANIKPMNHGHTNHKLIYRDGFIYALGNSPMVANEKYDVDSNTWTDTSYLPKRFLVKNTQDQLVSTAYVSYLD